MKPTADILVLNLSDLIQINERVKNIRKLSANVNITALNSFLFARRAGTEGNGFAVVSEELRNFSSKLTNISRILQTEVFRMVRIRAERVKRAKIFDKFNALRKHTTTPEVYYKRGAQHLLEGLNQLHANFTDIRKKILGHLDAATTLCETADALHRNAKVEAAYVSGLTQQLTEISDDVHKLISGITDDIIRIRVQVGKT